LGKREKKRKLFLREERRGGARISTRKARPLLMKTKGKGREGNRKDHAKWN